MNAADGTVLQQHRGACARSGCTAHINPCTWQVRWHRQSSRCLSQTDNSAILLSCRSCRIAVISCWQLWTCKSPHGPGWLVCVGIPCRNTGVRRRPPAGYTSSPTQGIQPYHGPGIIEHCGTTLAPLQNCNECSWLKFPLID
jgi:hypothetical protein